MRTTSGGTGVMLQIAKRLIGPVAGYCVRHGITFQDFSRLSKEAFVEAAEIELKKSELKINISRLSVMTGIQRIELKRIRGQEKEPRPELVNVPARVVSTWLTNSEFCKKNGTPRVLRHFGESDEFTRLVRCVNTNYNPGTVLFDLERTGTIERTPEGIRLLNDTLGLARFPEQGYQLLVGDVEALVQAVEENLAEPEKAINLHIHTEYDNIYERDLPKIRTWLIDQGRKFHSKVRKFLVDFDADLTTSSGRNPGKAGARVVISSFSVIDEGK